MVSREKLVLTNLYKTIEDRRDNPTENSYTCYLLDKGTDKILKKIGEECSETIIAAKNGDNVETIYEISDLLYHLLVVNNIMGVSLDDLRRELLSRHK